MFKITILACCFFITDVRVASQSVNLPPYEEDWSNTPGDWEEFYFIDGDYYKEGCSMARICISFLASIHNNVPTCLRYLDPHVIHEDREIPGHIIETGTPGEPDWIWEFQTDEVFTGPFIWKIKTIDICPKIG